MAKTHIQCDMNQQCHVLTIYDKLSRDLGRHVLVV